MRWYTAVGVKMDQPGGSFCVQVGAEKKILSGMEIYIMGFSLLSEMEFFAVPKNGISLNI